MAKTLNRKVTIYINGKEVEATLKSLRAEVKRLENEQAKLPIGTEEYIKTSMQLRKVRTLLNEQVNATKDAGTSWHKMTQEAAYYSNVLMGLQSAFQMLDLGIGKLKDLAKDAAALDDAYGQVMKTTGLTHKEVEELNEAFKQMDTRTAREQLNELAYEAGKLGITGVEAVEQFVSASDKINIALGDVLGEGAMVTIGKMADVYSRSTKQLADETGNLEKQMLSIGSAVNELGKVSTANEGYMVDFAARMGGVATQAGLGAGEVLGFASALDQSMQKVEMSATAFQKFIGQIMKKPAEFAAQAKMSVEDFTNLIRTDLNDALFRVLEGFQGQGGYAELVNIFKDLGLDGARAATVISSMANSIDKIRDAQAVANRELNDAKSIMGEYDVMNNTMQATAEKAKKRFEEVRIELGNELYPVLISLQRSGTVLMKGAAGLVQLLKENKALLIPMVGLLLSMVRAKLAAAAANMSLQKAIDLVTFARTRENIAMAKAERLAAKERAQRAQALVQRIQERIAINNEVLAREREAAAQGQNNALAAVEAKQKRLNIALTKSQTIATEANTAAQRALGNVVKAQQWGWLFLALTAVVGVVGKVTTKMRESREAIEGVGSAGAEAEAKVRVLFNRLREAGEGTEEYKNALSDLKAEYPDLISAFIDENGKLKDLEKAYRDVSAAARQAAMDQAFGEQTSKIYSEELKKQQEAMEKANKAIMNSSNWKKGTTRAEMEEGWRSYTEWVNKAKQGEVSWAVAIGNAGHELREMGYKQKSFTTGVSKVKVYMEEMAAATASADNKVKKLQETLGTVYSYNPSKATGGSSSASSIGNTNEGGSGGSESALPIDKAAEKARQAWERFGMQYQQLVGKLEARSESGISKISAEVDLSIAKMKEELQNVDLAVHPEAVTMLQQLEESASKWKKQRIDEYISSMEKNLAKLKSRMTGKEESELEKAQRQLRESIEEADEAIIAASMDRENANKEEAERLDEIISKYQQLKNMLIERLELPIAIEPDATETESIQAQLQAVIDAIDVPFNFNSIINWYDNTREIVDEFVNYTTDAMGSLNQILDNIGDRELKSAEEKHDKEVALLEDQLTQGLISQEDYNAKKERLDQQLSDKEKEIKLEQWRREKNLNMSQAAMKEALAVLDIWKEHAGDPILAAALTAATLAVTGLQIGAIASEPAPYAEGGYVKKRTIFQAGEAGEEWVASNKLLRDPSAAAMIAALEAYQRGNSRALTDIPMASIDVPAAVSAAREIGRRQVVMSQRSAWDVPTQEAVGTGAAEMVTLMRELSGYLRDPRNRQAVITRRSMDDFNNKEEFLRSQAAL